MVDQDEEGREQRRQQHIGDRSRRDQQQDDRERAAIDVEMAKRMHKVFQEEG